MFVAGLLVFFARLVCGVRPSWLGCQPDIAQRVYFSNHTSHLDAIVIWAALPRKVRRLTRPVAAKDYWTSSWLRRHLATRVFNAVLIDRTLGDYHHNPVDDLVDALGDRWSLILFPEGSRGNEPAPGPFRSGLYHLALRRPDVPLVPVHLSNLERVMPRGASLPAPLLSKVIFGKPLHIEVAETRDVFLSRAREAVLSLGS